MESSNLEFKTIRPIDLNDEALKPGSKATPFSTFIWAITSGDIATAETQITDDIEWGMMCYNKMLKGNVTDRQYGATDVRRNGAIPKCLKWGLERCQEWVFLAPFAMVFLGDSGSGLGARKLSPSRISR